MEIVLLGTGAALPTSLRSGAATAVIRQGEVLLFDCGEGTQVQFLKAGLKPGKLSKIFISHFHGDHFYGLIGFLTSLQLGGRDKPLHLYGPEGMAAYLDAMQALSHFSFKYEIACHEVAAGTKEVTWDLGEYRVQALPLDHRLPALGFRIEEKPTPGKFDVAAACKLAIPEGPLRAQLQAGKTVALPDGRQVQPGQVLGPARPGKKVAIILDTSPCANSRALAKDVDLLVHEGTFDAESAGRAQATRHSTVVDAAQTAREAGARKLVLTHISARYFEDDWAELLAQARAVFANTILGKDLLAVQI